MAGDTLIAGLPGGPDRVAEGAVPPTAAGPYSPEQDGDGSLRVLWFAPGRCESMSALDVERMTEAPALGYAWVDAHSDAPRAWVSTVERLTGVSILDEHLVDAENGSHPSYFDSTRDYEMIVFRGLALKPTPDPDLPIRIRTRPTVFFLFPRCVVCLRPADSQQVPELRRRLLEAGQYRHRLPARPEELMLRILNGMVDRYLALRQPLTDQLERAQRDLLDPRRPFRDWVSLLEGRRELRKLEDLSEEQLDALQEWRDERLDRHVGRDERESGWGDATVDDTRTAGATAMPALTDALEVRINDLVEHIQRVRAHAQRLETSVESAVQLHFSATAHRTNQIMRTLTVLTATFMPLTLITGIFGMNFEVMPGIHSRSGFWWTMATMAGIAAMLVGFFRWRRYLDETGLRGGSSRRKPSRGGTRSADAAQGPPTIDRTPPQIIS